MDSRYVSDSKSGKKYYYLINFYSSEVEQMAANHPDTIRYKDGYLIPKIPSLNQFVRMLSIADGNNKIKEEKEKKEIEYKKLLSSKADDYAVVDRIQKSIIAKRTIELLPDSCQQLMNHQRGGSVIAEHFDKFAFFYDTGTGKTVMALDIIQRKHKEKDAHFLILCPKTIINSAWMDDCEHFFQDLKLLPLTSNYSAEQYRMLFWRWKKNDSAFSYNPCFFLTNKQQRDIASQKFMLTQADHFIVNYELFNRDPDRYLHIKSGEHIIDIDGIIVDESSILKSGNSVTYDNIHNAVFVDKVRYLYLFSGKPAPNRLSEYIPQIRLVAPYLRLPRIETVDDGSAAEELLTIIKKASITVAKKDCFDLPEITENIHFISFDSKIKRQYSNLSYQFVTELDALEKEGNTTKSIIFINHVLACISKLRQLTGGFVINENEIIHVHDYKLDELLAVVEELSGEQAIIWCQYKHEIRAIESMLVGKGYTVATAYSGTKDKDSSIRDFKDGKVDFLIAHPRTLQYGVTLTNCCVAIYYSTSYSFEEYYQSHDRIYRKGQSLPCTFVFLQVENTIDEIMWNVIQKKKDKTELTELFLKHLKSVMIE